MKVDLDFTNVKSSARIRVPEGDYIAKVKKVEKGKSAKKGTPQLSVQFLLMSGGQGVEGKAITDRHYLTEASLWTLRNMLEAMGYQVPAGPMKFTDKMIVGKKVGLTIIDGEEYKGRISSEVADYIPANVVGNKVSSDEAEYPGDTDAGDDDDAFGFDDDEDSEDEPVDSDDSDDEDDDEDSDDEGFAFDADDEDEEDEEEDGDEEEDALSFDSDDVTTAKAAELKAYVGEAIEAGYEFDLPKKPKAAQVREALLSIFTLDEEEDDDDDEMEDFDLDDVE